jgi:hypothetical protein
MHNHTTLVETILSGIYSRIANTYIGRFTAGGTMEFDPPGEGKAGNDLVLLLEAADLPINIPVSPMAFNQSK